MLVVILALGLTGAPAGAQDGGLGSDVFGNVTPKSPVEGDDRLINRWPMSHYQLDVNVDQGTFGVGNIGPVIFSELAASLWEFTGWVTKLAIDLFTWAFSLDLINGDRGPATAGPPSPGEASGALDPVANAVDNLYTNVLGRSWMVAAIIAAGLWGTWKALVQRRYTESAGALAISVVFAVLALWIINSPQATVGVASEMSNDMSLAFLAGVTRGDVANPTKARADVADTLFERHIHDPWVVLNFGGLRHCVNTESEVGDGYPRPVGPYDPKANVCRHHVERGSDGHGGYASRFLAHPPRSDQRVEEFEALRQGETPDDPDASLGAAGGGGAYEVDKSDSPAVDIQQAGGAYQRVALAGIIALLNLGAVVLLGFLSLAIILAQVLALVLLAFAPIALIVGIFPGRGHEFFKTWGAKLLTAIAIKAIYSLILAIILAVGLAVSATADAGEMNFLFAFGLQALFFWAIFIYRKQLVSRLTQATTARTGERSESSPLRYIAAGGALRLATQPVRSLRRAGTGRPPPGAGDPGRRPGPTNQTPRRSPPSSNGQPEHPERAKQHDSNGASSPPSNTGATPAAAAAAAPSPRGGADNGRARRPDAQDSARSPHRTGPSSDTPRPAPDSTRAPGDGQSPPRPRPADPSTPERSPSEASRPQTPRELHEETMRRLRESRPRPADRPPPRPAERPPPPRSPDRRGPGPRGPQGDDKT